MTTMEVMVMVTMVGVMLKSVNEVVQDSKLQEEESAVA
jgi:hypothetical protein